MSNAKLFLAAGAAMALTAAAPADPVRDTSFKEANGERVLQLSVDVKAAPQCVWNSFADEEGIKAHGVKLAHVDMRNGGDHRGRLLRNRQAGGQRDHPPPHHRLSARSG